MTEPELLTINRKELRGDAAVERIGDLLVGEPGRGCEQAPVEMVARTRRR